MVENSLGLGSLTVYCRQNLCVNFITITITLAEGNVDEMNASYQNETKVKV